MLAFGKWVGRHRVLILVVAVLLLVPAFIGMRTMRINYDLLVYLPEDIETMRGQDILVDEFGIGAFAMYMAEGMDDQQLAELEERMEDVEGVKSVVWKDDLMDLSVPTQILPSKFRDAFNNEDTTLMAIFFEDTSSSDETMEAVREIRALSEGSTWLGGVTGTSLDTMDLINDQEPLYVLIAVVCMAAVVALFSDSWIIPLFFLADIGAAIVYNLGTNAFLGQISYITQALAAVLQLAVTMDYSIFLWHSYQQQLERFPGENERAMAHAIKATFVSVVGSSVTTIAGFLALCFMRFTLGYDLGLVLAKGVLFGVVCCVTVLPSMILVFEKAIRKTMHRSLMPGFDSLCGWITRRYKAILPVFAVLLVPMTYGYLHTSVYYRMDSSLPRDLPSVVATEKLEDDFGLATSHMVLVDQDLGTRDKYLLARDMEAVDGVDSVLGLESVKGEGVPEQMIPDRFRDLVESGTWELMLVNSRYELASDELNAQIDQLNGIIHGYDPGGMLIGEGPLTKDLIEITDTDFQVVTWISIAAVFVIIFFVLGSWSLPILLVAAIESAIFINLGIPYFMGEVLPFIASIVVGTIQLGATVDYAILMTTRYIRERSRGAGRVDSVSTALKASISSILVSGLGFFAATFGVGAYSTIDLVGSICRLLSRGALCSMVVVIFVLPALLLLFDRLICASTLSLRRARRENKLAEASAS